MRHLSSAATVNGRQSGGCPSDRSELAGMVRHGLAHRPMHPNDLGYRRPAQISQIWISGCPARSELASAPNGGSVRFADVEDRSRGVKRRPRPRDFDRRARRSQIRWGWPARWPAFARAGKLLWQASGMQMDEMLRNHWRSSNGHAKPADDSVRVCCGGTTGRVCLVQMSSPDPVTSWRGASRT